MGAERAGRALYPGTGASLEQPAGYGLCGAGRIKSVYAQITAEGGAGGYHSSGGYGNPGEAGTAGEVLIKW